MTALALVAKFWREGAIALLMALCGVLVAVNARKADQLRVCQQARLADQAAWRAASEKAKADDLANARAVETRNDTISKEQADDLQSKLAQARAAAAAYSTRLRAQTSADRSSSGRAHLPEAGTTTGGAVGAGQDAFVSVPAEDLDICAVNSAKAGGWLAWYTAISTSQQSAQP